MTKRDTLVIFSFLFLVGFALQACGKLDEIATPIDGGIMTSKSSVASDINQTLCEEANDTDSDNDGICDKQEALVPKVEGESNDNWRDKLAEYEPWAMFLAAFVGYEVRGYLDQDLTGLIPFNFGTQTSNAFSGIETGQWLEKSNETVITSNKVIFKSIVTTEKTIKIKGEKLLDTKSNEFLMCINYSSRVSTLDLDDNSSKISLITKNPAFASDITSKKGFYDYCMKNTGVWAGLKVEGGSIHYGRINPRKIGLIELINEEGKKTKEFGTNNVTVSFQNLLGTPKISFQFSGSDKQSPFQTLTTSPLPSQFLDCNAMKDDSTRRQCKKRSLLQPDQGIELTFSKTSFGSEEYY